MKRSSFAILSVIFDILLVNASFVLAFLIRFQGTLPQFNFDAYLILAPLISIVYVACCWLNDLYNPSAFLDVLTVVRKVIVSTIIATAIIMAAAFLGGETTSPLARLSLAIAWVLATFFLIVWRYLFMRFGSIRWPRQNVLIIGGGQVRDDLIKEIENRAHRGWRCVGVLSNTSELDEATPTAEIDRIIITSPSDCEETITKLVLVLDKRVVIDVVPGLYEVFLGKFDSTIGDIPLTRVARIAKPGYFEIIKRAFDIVFSVVCIVLASPVMAVAFLLVKSEDGGAFLYKQERVGKAEKPFTLYKVRTMRINAESSSGPVLATVDDPRMTRQGKSLRRYRIDEIPQLINILKGNMSFVGPRPERPFFVEKYKAEIPAYSERFRIRPGATGLAQVNGGYATDPKRKLKYDLIYLYHRDLALDTRILTETIKVVFTGRGAR